MSACVFLACLARLVSGSACDTALPELSHYDRLGQTQYFFLEGTTAPSFLCPGSKTQVVCAKSQTDFWSLALDAFEGFPEGLAFEQHLGG